MPGIPARLICPLQAGRAIAWAQELSASVALCEVAPLCRSGFCASVSLKLRDTLSSACQPWENVRQIV